MSNYTVFEEYNSFTQYFAYNLLNLSPADQSTFFQILTDNIDLFKALIGNDPEWTLFHYVKTGEILADDNPPVIQAYIQWKASKGA
jgi:hypothetical protein